MRSSLDDRLDVVKLAAAVRTFQRYGLPDLFREQAIAPSAPGLYNSLVSGGKQVGELVRDAHVGSPVTMTETLRQHYKDTGSVPRSVGRYLRDFYMSPGTPLLLKALSIGLPLYGVGSALLSEPEHRPERVASSAAGLLTSPFSMRLGGASLPIEQGLESAVGKGTAKALKRLHSRDLSSRRHASGADALTD